jgi:hypothetical protein
MKNEFLLHLKSDNIEQTDELFLKLINSNEFDAVLVGKKMFKNENKVAYRIRISTSSLIGFKKRFDETIRCESLQLFEFKEW